MDTSPENTVRIDVDGSVTQQHQAACGGVLRNAQGEWLMGFYKPLGLLSVIETETYAIIIGLQIGLQMGLQSIVIYSDSLDAVNILMRDCPTDHPLKYIIGETRDLLFRDWDVELHHIPRENISYADYMTKEGHNVAVGVDVVMIPTIPSGCLDMVLMDQRSCHS